MIVIGTDEAGYGPNLGPLVVSLTAWITPTADLSILYEPLKQQGVHIGDSKKIFRGGSLAALETGVLVPQRALQKNVMPVEIAEKKLSVLTKRFEHILHENKVQLLEMIYRSIEPEEFNRLLNQFNSKGSLLSDTTLRLVVKFLKNIKQHISEVPPILVLCDKHGGRNRYLDILTMYFPGEFITTICETREKSIYRLSFAGRLLEFRFLAKGESHLPIASASMLSKYQRELAMIRFNNFWCSHIPGLLPTAGYPEDAGRFKKDISAVQQQLGIADVCLWRNR